MKTYTTTDAIIQFNELLENNSINDELELNVKNIKDSEKNS